jgi:cytochrome c
MGNDPLLFNKIAAAVLSAGLLAMITGFIAHELYHPHHLEKPAYEIAAGVTSAAEKQTAAAPAGPQAIAPLLAKANADEGKKIAKKCESCHTFDKDGKNKIGPNLWGVIGRKHAGHEGFSYSAAMQATPGTWDYETLNKFIYNPRGYVNGTKMTFAGLKNDQERADVIAFLRTLSDSPKPLP